MLTLLAAALALVATASPARAVQASGDDVPVWSTGWSWTYQTTFRYVGADADVTLNETVTYTVAGAQSFNGQDAYRLNISGTITGGSGSAQVDGVGNVSLSNFSGTVSGTKYVRRSDLAMLQETQAQHLNGTAKLGFISTGITADIDLQMTPQGGWRALVFPLDAGQTWQNNVAVDYDGGFSYEAGSLASGADTFDGTFSMNAPSSVTNATISAAGGSVSTRRVHSQDGDTVNTHWYSPGHRNDARELLQLPLDGATLTLDRTLSSASTPAPATTLTATITPSLTCAGDQVTIAGRLSTGQSGVPVTVRADGIGTVNAATTTGGNYTANLTAPAAGDGKSKTGARGSWGVLVSAGGATAATTLVVTPQNCTTLTYDGATAAPQGGTATVSATLTDLTGGSTAGRTVTFTLSGGATVSASTNAAGVAQTQIPVAGPPRDATITASFAAAGNLVAASDSSPFAVGTIPTTTTVAATPPVVTVGDPVRFTAEVAAVHGAKPGGTVQFQVDGADFGSAVALADGSATSPNLSTLGLGFHEVVAVYNGTADHSPSTSAAFTFRVRPPLLATTTSSTVEPSTAVAGQPVTLSATVGTTSGTPTGEVVFTAGATELGRAAVGSDGKAALTLEDVPVGSHQVVATYSGDDVYGASAAPPRGLTVEKADVSVSLESSDATTVTGEAVSFTASVAVQAPGGGTPGGSVQLEIDGAPVGAPVELTDGSAVFGPITSLGAGSHVVSAAYAGSARYQGGSDQVDQTVEKASTSTTVLATPSPSLEEQPVELIASVVADAPGSGAPTGTVTFLADGDPIGSAPLANGQARLEVSDLAPGDYQVAAEFAGDADYLASESEPVSHTVLAGTAVVATTLALSSSENPSTYGGLITFTADVDAADDSAPAGAVQFSVDGQDIGDPVPVGPGGIAESPALASPDPGDHTVIAAFVPEVGFSGSGDLLTQTVEAAPVTVELVPSDADAQVGDEVSFSATVESTVTGTGTPTGWVQFSVDGVPLGRAVELVDGTAGSEVVDDLTPGDHTVTAIYSGDLHFAPQVATTTQSVHRVATTTTLEVADASVTYGDAVEVTATVTPEHGDLGAPGGTVDIVDGDDVIATVPVAADGTAGVATATLTGLGAGSHQLRAVYSGDDEFDPSSSDDTTVTVGKLATTLTPQAALVSVSPLGLPLGQLKVTLTAGGDPLAGAAIEFKVGTKVVCQATTDARGVAACNAASQILGLVLNGGYTASYAGDADHLATTVKGGILK
ncbi:hypothetical protein HNR19_001014 [Nocardioides thalensis]|uniref:Bacterial Ig-like domain-containing protein n=1 Tax=Nocardioides thalensis TaxID=1914755 RepID=A0A853BZW4_9ACTN|nr:hypothetical protein [Nocardioides thalensis]